MNNQAVEENRRILIIDDNRAVHEDFHKILKASDQKQGEILKTEYLVFGVAPAASAGKEYEIDYACQGEEGFARVQQAAAAGQRYALAFVDVRMPPGWDGLETTARIWAVDPDVQIVLCTAYADSSWDEMIAKLGQSDRLLILKKPFDSIEVLQLANALSEKWLLLQQSRLKVHELEGTVRELQESEANSRRALQREHELHQIKGRFVTMVSHEFRTPLGVIGIAAEVLGRYSDRLTPEQKSSKLSEIQTAVERMTEMMEEFLTYGEGESGKLECKRGRLDLEELCRRVISEESRQRRIECFIEPVARHVFLDGKLVRHILGNLLSNAIKYSDPGQAVQLEIRRRDGCIAGGAAAPHLQFTVRDAGIGIPAEDLAQLCRTFHRAANVGQRPGTGMGLAIVRQCVELHGGSLEVESEEGVGTLMRVCLPLVEPDQKTHSLD